MSVKLDATRLVLDLGKRNDAVAAKLLPLIYDELHQLARRSMRKERAGHTLQATALVNEAYLRLVDQSRVDLKSRTHFFALAAKTIRRILIDHARKRSAIKRGKGKVGLTLAEAADLDTTDRKIELLDLDEALQKLAELSERQARVVELRFFAGLSIHETAQVLDISPETVKGDWRVARAWLKQNLER